MRLLKAVIQMAAGVAATLLVVLFLPAAIITALGSDTFGGLSGLVRMISALPFVSLVGGLLLAVFAKADRSR